MNSGQVNLEAYRAFTFALLFKKGRKNGMKYEDETLSGLHKKLGIKTSYNTFIKYWNILLQTGCIKKEGRHLQLVSWKECAVLLHISEIGDKHVNQLFNKKDISVMTFSQSVGWLLEILLVYNFRAQHHKLKPLKRSVDVAHCLLNGSRNSDKNFQAGIKKLVKKAAQEGMDTFSYARCLLRDNDAYIKTGSYHISQLLGISQRKANRLLIQMEKDGMIKRYVIKHKHDLPYSNASFDFLKEELKEKIFFPTKKSGFIEVLGSKIELPEENGVLSLFFPAFGEREVNPKPITIYKPILKTIKYTNGK